MTHPWDPTCPPPSGLVRPVRVDPSGQEGPTRGRSQGPGWRRTSPGLFVPAGVDGELVEQRILEAATGTGTGTVVTAWAALRLHGAAFFDGLRRDGRTPLPVTICANGARCGTRPGVLVRRSTVPDDEVVLLHGLLVTTVERALFDEMCRHTDPRERVVAADMAFAARITSLRRMRRYCAERRWSRDVRQVLAALVASSEHSRSPQETRFRQVWVIDAGWSDPLCNRRLLDLDGRQIAVPDLLDVERGVVGEYAGADHRDIDRHERDIAREAAIRALGLEYVEVVGRDLRDPARVVRRMVEAQARVRQGPRRWRLGPAPPPLE